MKKALHKLLVIISVQLICLDSSFSQLDSILDQGIYRSFIVHKPIKYDFNKQYPLVINLHGLNSNAAQQELYTQFDNVADTTKFIVVYPNAIAGSWTFAGTMDVDFISHLIDTIQNRFSCNSCLFFTGMSMGGFMTYKLACDLPKPISAIAVVSGNMLQLWENNCVISKGLPVLDFHGTADAIVNYNGTFGIPPVDTTIKWWVKENKCNPVPKFISLPNTNLMDSSIVEKYSYEGGKNNSKVVFYKVINGGHTWPGGFPLPPLGNTNQDINASALIGNFFESYCVNSVGVNSSSKREDLQIYPNPAQNNITIEFQQQQFNLDIFEIEGKKIFSQKNVLTIAQIDCSNISSGIYLLRVTNGKGRYNQKLIINK